MVLSQLPLTPNGKVDRRALPLPEGRSQVQQEYVAPRTPVQETLAEIWREVLRVEEVGIEDNFFELGGHSLLATQVMSRVRERFGVELPLRVLFESPTVAELAQRVEWESRAGEGVMAPPLVGQRAGSAVCRCRLRRSGCGFWISWSRGARPTTCRRRCG